MNRPNTPAEVKAAVQQHYSAVATRAGQPAPRPLTELPMADAAGCCTPTALDAKTIAAALYAIDDLVDLPPAAVLAARGCGNPLALAELHRGETVLDLGSGGGIDVLLSARRVGSTGFAYGLDMTPGMVELARRNAQEAGVTNVNFLHGEIEEVPLLDSSVDVVLSNCVINLSADKARVLAEAFRVLKPGGRFAVSDIVVQGTLPEALRSDLELWAGCIAGALEEGEYRRLLAEAGFTGVEVQVTHSVDLPERLQARHASPEIAGQLVSAFVRAVKPR